jgi:hypothetical protein
VVPERSHLFVQGFLPHRGRSQVDGIELCAFGLWAFDSGQGLCYTSQGWLVSRPSSVAPQARDNGVADARHWTEEGHRVPRAFLCLFVLALGSRKGLG